ncbi:hypothetical protein C8R46DRAFT_1211852 [Mycena filopes]|nr:hypothetical protein C8R46DRAFT_1211852 [Mycena filopes]
MPRILPRLVKLPLSANYPFPTPKPKPPPPPPRPLHSVLPRDYPRSVLLSEPNIITHSHDYDRHKGPPPFPPHRRRIPAKTAHLTTVPREMSAQEHKWWSSPYLRMLSTPIRLCYLSQRFMPTDFLIRLGTMRVPLHLQRERKRAVNVFFPDGLQHPKFKLRRAKSGLYILCRRTALAILDRPNKFKRTGATPPPRLGEQIAHFLRLRVLQELQVLLKHLNFEYRTRTGPVPARPPILRRLTRGDWGTFRTTGILPHPGALALLVVPPVNRDPATRERPPNAGAMSTRPLPDAPPEQPPKRPTPPLSVLHPTRPPPVAAVEIITAESTTAEEFWTNQLRERERGLERVQSPAERLIETLAHMTDESVTEADEVKVQPHAQERVPLYNGVALFPGRIQRAKLHALLTQILGLEGAARFSAGAAAHDADKEAGNERRTKQKGDNKGSHAFLISSSTNVDMVPLAIALWRVRMWEGGGWKTDEDEKEEWSWVEELPLEQ